MSELEQTVVWLSVPAPTEESFEDWCFVGPSPKIAPEFPASCIEVLQLGLKINWLLVSALGLQWSWYHARHGQYNLGSLVDWGKDQSQAEWVESEDEEGHKAGFQSKSEIEVQVASGHLEIKQREKPRRKQEEPAKWSWVRLRSVAKTLSVPVQGFIWRKQCHLPLTGHSGDRELWRVRL